MIPTAARYNNVTVLPTYAAPVCDLAKAKTVSVWPPNHKLVRAEIIGVSDPNNNPVSIAILGVTQDEPTQGLGDGDTAVDAVRSGSAVLIRAERAGTGNGRVYSLEVPGHQLIGEQLHGSRVGLRPEKLRRGLC